MPYEFDWVDGFSARPFCGNGCAVVYGADRMDAAQCMAIVRETGLVECTFLGASDLADIKVRYFLANREIPFAGHPTLATVASMADRGLIEGGAVRLETGAGVIPVEVDSAAPGAPMITMTQIAPEIGPQVPADLVAAVGGLDAGDIVGEPRIVSTGLPFCVTVVKDHETLAKVRLDLAVLEKFREGAGTDLRDVMEPFWVTLQGASAAGRTFSRLLLAPPLPPEDPFTGSATGAMAAYLWSERRIDAPRFVAEQGHWMGRPGQAQVEVLGPPDAITGVRVGGQGYVLMRGYLNL